METKEVKAETTVHPDGRIDVNILVPGLTMQPKFNFGNQEPSEEQNPKQE